MFKLFNYFLAASAGYAFAKMREQQDRARAALEGEVCFTRIPENVGLAGEVAAYFEDALTRGAQLLTSRVGDVVTVIAIDTETGQIINQYVGRVEDALAPPPAGLPPGDSGVIDSEVV
jgi:hypothetical protein